MRVEMGLEGPFNMDARLVDASEQLDVASTTGACSPGDCASTCLQETICLRSSGYKQENLLE